MTSALNIYVHLPKTAGEVFKRNIENSLSKKKFIRTSFAFQESYYDIAAKKYSFYRDQEHFVQYVQSLRTEQINQIHCIGGHNSYYGIHELFKRPFRYIAFFREPVARTVSLYNFERMAFEIYSKKREVLNPLETGFLKRMSDNFIIDGKIPEFEPWLEQVYNKKTPFYFSMTSYLQYLGFLEGLPTQQAFEKALEKFYFVGITEKHNEDTLFLYHELKVKRFAADPNASLPYISVKNLDRALLAKIKEANKEDELLYQMALKENQQFKERQKNFSVILEKMERKKRVASFQKHLKEPAVKFGKRLKGAIKTLIKKGLRKCNLVYQRPSSLKPEALGSNLKNTDERYVPWSEDFCTGYEHIHRYDFATKFVQGKKVLDLACGEGYGSYLLAKAAHQVIGVDSNSEVIEHANSAYKKSNLSFAIGEMTKVPLARALFDVVVCFEALEHIIEHAQLLEEVQRLLTKEGLFIVSSPHKTVYSNNGTKHNPYHLKELDFPELESLLRSYFQYTVFYGQKTYAASKIFPVQACRASITERHLKQDPSSFTFSEEVDPLPRYYVALASNAPLKEFQETSYLVDISLRNGYIKWVAT